MARGKYLLPLVMAVHSAAFAQNIPPASIEDQVLGWIKPYAVAAARQPLKIDDRVYSPVQLSIADDFARWIQASYVPKGGLGDLFREFSPKLDPYNQNTAARPQSYGAYALTYMMLKYDSSKKMVPLSLDGFYFSVMANGVYGAAADALNTPTQYYFTLPSFEEAGYGFSPYERTLYDLSTHPRLGKYIHYYQRNSRIGNQQIVLLSKDRKSPFVTITKGEYLQVVEAAVARLYEQETAKILANNKGNQRSIDYFTGYLNEKHAKRLASLTTNKEKYANRLQETAVIFTDQPDVLLENYPDIFEGTGASRVKLPVYKIDPVMAELCKTDKPQWIMVSWFGGATLPIGKHQHEAVVNNFNFDYVYNYFFDPEKIRGQPYTPLRSPLAEETTLREASAAATAARADPAVHFFDDFSTVSPGQKPAGWSTDAAVTTATVDGLPGNWAVLSGDHANGMTSRQLRTPLPQNFTLSYELAVPRDFTWGAGGLSVELSADQSGRNPSYVRVNLRPSFAAGRAGGALIQTKVPPGYEGLSKLIDAPGFSNDKKNNRVHVSIRKTGETLAVFLDKVRIAEFDKAIPSGLQVDGMSFTMGGNYKGPNDKFCVGSIKIVREPDPVLK